MISQEKDKAEIIEKDGRSFIRINPEDLDLEKMMEVQKVTEIIAFQVKEGKVNIISRHNEFEETHFEAKVGDWIICNIGEMDKGLPMINKLLGCNKKVIDDEKFKKLYSSTKTNLVFNKEDSSQIYKQMKSDNEDNSDFSDFNFIESASQHKYIGQPVFAANVPFNFVIKAPWGEDQFIKKGGAIIFNPHTSKENEKDIYGIDAARRRHPGQFEKTYRLAQDKGLIVDTFKMVLKADRSPLPGIQFNNLDLARAYEIAGKELSSALEKYASH